MYKLIHFMVALKNTIGIMWWVTILSLWPISHITQTTITPRGTRSCIPGMYCDLTNTNQQGTINHGNVRQEN